MSLKEFELRTFQLSWVFGKDLIHLLVNVGLWRLVSSGCVHVVFEKEPIHEFRSQFFYAILVTFERAKKCYVSPQTVNKSNFSSRTLIYIKTLPTRLKFFFNF